jgi:hypothetical protein
VEQHERDGCLFWDIILHKKSQSDKYGFVQANGRFDHRQKLAKAQSGAGLQDGEQLEDISIAAPEVLVVHKVNKDGLLDAWNQRYPEAEVRLPDRIISVNGETTVEGMQREIREPRIHIKLCRYPERFTVALSKAGGAKLGFRFEKPMSRDVHELRVSEVLTDGSLPDHNAQQSSLGHWHQMVLPEMRIEKVNSVEGDSWEMTHELKRCANVTLQIRRAEISVMTQKQVGARLRFLASIGRKKRLLKPPESATQSSSIRKWTQRNQELAAQPPGSPSEEQQRGAMPSSMRDALTVAGGLGPNHEAAGDSFAAAAMLLLADKKHAVEE